MSSEVLCSFVGDCAKKENAENKIKKQIDERMPESRFTCGDRVCRRLERYHSLY